MTMAEGSGTFLGSREPVLPPGFSLHVLSEGDAFSHALAQAQSLGAAALVWRRRPDLLDFAVVLEPDQPLMTARLSHYAAMNAVADAFSVHCPPEKPIRFQWPDALTFDLGLIGGGRTAWPEACAEDEVPDWIVFGATIRAASPDRGEYDATRVGLSMEEAGFEDVDFADLIESFCRHLMLNVHRWQNDGPRSVVRRWLDRLEPVEGSRRGIEPNGDLLAKGREGETRGDFVAALARVAWRDPVTGEPRR
jgi:biotin-(acetyl-CoA carboxylase) ligase